MLGFIRRNHANNKNVIYTIQVHVSNTKSNQFSGKHFFLITNLRNHHKQIMVMELGTVDVYLILPYTCMCFAPYPSTFTSYESKHCRISTDELHLINRNITELHVLSEYLFYSSRTKLNLNIANKNFNEL